MQQIKIHIGINLFLLIGIFSCQQQKGAAEQYISYLQDPAHGLRQSQTGKLFAYRMQVLTPESQALMSMPAAQQNPARLAALVPQYQESQTFIIALEPLAAGKALQDVLKEAVGEEMGNMLHQQMQYGLESCFQLVQGIDTLPCMLYQAQAPMFRGGALQMNLVFPKIRPNEDIQLKGNIPDFPEAFPSFTIRKTDLSNIPNIKL
jgi:hypothetical protein